MKKLITFFLLTSLVFIGSFAPYDDLAKATPPSPEIEVTVWANTESDLPLGTYDFYSDLLWYGDSVQLKNTVSITSTTPPAISDVHTVVVDPGGYSLQQVYKPGWINQGGVCDIGGVLVSASSFIIEEGQTAKCVLHFFAS